MKRRLLLPSLWSLAALSCSPDVRELDTLERALAGHRPYQLRLSFQTRHAPCALPAMPSDTTLHAFAPIDCSPPDEKRTRRIIARAARYLADARMRSDSSAALARVDLLMPGSTAAYGRAIDRLEQAVQQDSSAALLNDLGVAYAARATAAQSPLDLLRAADNVLRALEHDSAFEPALYNRALLLDRLSLAGEAAAAWSAFTRAEPRSAWAREAPLRAATRVERDPQPLREDSARPALARWGTAWLRGDTAAAADALATARRIGRELADATVADAVMEIEAASAAQRRRLAEAQTAFERGERAFSRGSFVEAAPELDRAAALYEDTRSPFRWWTALTRAGVKMYDLAPAEADSLGTLVLQQANPSRYPALIGRAYWLLALNEARLGTHERVLQRYAAGIEAYTRAGENESRGALEMLTAASMQLLGQGRAAERNMLRALQLMAAYPASPRLHDGLLWFGRHLTGLGLYATARAVHFEGLRVAARTGREKDPGEVRVRLAQNAVAAGRPAEAERHLAEARAVYDQVDDELMRQRGEVDILDTQSALVLHDRPTEAVRLLSDAVSYFSEHRSGAGSIRALTLRSAALRAEGRNQEAAADLQHAIELYERNLNGSATARAALQESAAAAYDAMIAAQLSMHRPDDALAYLMRSHGSSAAAVEAAGRARGGRVLAYAVLPDELVIWSFDGTAWSAARVPAGAAVVSHTVNSFLTALRRRDTTSAARLGRSLHRMLIPSGTLGDGDTPLLIVPDRVLSSVPFAALRDPLNGDYLAERALISLYAAGRGARPRTGGAHRVLVASAARFDSRTFPDLAPLPAAEKEATRIASLYDGATLLQGEQATPRRLLAELRRHDVLHFAGHARALPVAPELSFLVTATGQDGANRVTASEIRKLDLRHLSLVVLGACSSAERGSGRSGELNGLAQAFLTAGAAAVVASVWEVEDAATAELLTALHREVLRGATAEAALRTAQLELLRSAEPRLREAAAWAGFQHYTS